MIKLRACALPSIERVTPFTTCTESGSQVIDRPCARVVCGMARIARRAQSNKCAAGGSPMAGFTRSRPVRSRERKSILMLANGTQLNAPSLDGVTAVAGWTELAAVNVRVARRA